MNDLELSEVLELYETASPETRKIVNIMLDKNIDYQTLLDSCDGDINTLLEGCTEERSA